MKTCQLGTLTAHITGGLDREGGGDGPVVVLMHGFGAPGTDLVSLWRALAVARDVRFVFPEAPHTLGGAYGDGRAWWMLDLEALQRRQNGEPVDRTKEVPEGLAPATQSVLDLLSALQEDYGARPERIVLGGFSQGSMLACDVALHSDLPLAGLILLSSTLLAEERWVPQMAARAGLPVLQTHGEQDPVLPYDGAVALRDRLKAAGADMEFVAFRGGHDIPHAAVDHMARFITRVTGS